MQAFSPERTTSLRFGKCHFKPTCRSSAGTDPPLYQTKNVKTLYLKTKFEPRHDKTNKMSVRPAKTQISLGIPQSDQILRYPHEESLGP